MPRSLLPDPLERRLLLERKIEPAQALRIAEAYLAESRTLEALAFLQRAGARERLDAIRAEAVGTGDAFLLREASKEMGRAPEASEWRALADAAASLGKVRYADQARRQVGRTGEG